MIGILWAAQLWRILRRQPATKLYYDCGDGGRRVVWAIQLHRQQYRFLKQDLELADRLERNQRAFERMRRELRRHPLDRGHIGTVELNRHDFQKTLAELERRADERLG